MLVQTVCAVSTAKKSSFVLKKNILEDGTDEENRTYYSKVIRHEVLHAALHESGLTHYANDELLVEWLAVQFPKLAEIFKKAGCST